VWLYKELILWYNQKNIETGGIPLKKLVACLLALCIMISLSACTSFLGIGTFYETSVDKYGKWENYLDVPTFLPSSVKDYTVHSYSYTLYSYMDVCYEIFVDITVEETEFDRLLESARAHSDSYEEQPADYCDGYMEIVFMDNYEQGKNGEQVGWADIEKVLYNPDTNNVVYVVFHANDTGVYDVKDVAYFNRFSIKADDYS
jgi:hypothetical protein